MTKEGGAALPKTKPTHSANKRARCGVLGARGYSGIELCRLLLGHSNADLVAVAATTTDWSLETEVFHPEAGNAKVLTPEKLLDSQLDFVFLATPHSTSIEMAPKFLEKGVQVIDLSGGFRLPPTNFKKAYGETHPSPSWIDRAHYGLVPWSKAPSSSSVQFVSNPGCYVTSVLMALLPLLKAGVIDPAHILIDAKSGTTGAGKKAEERLSFSELDENLMPYRIGNHQHEEEIRYHLEALSSVSIPSVIFVPHLIPVRRGILSSMYLKLNPQAKLGVQDISAIFHNAYEGYPLLTHSPAKTNLMTLAKIAGTPRTHLFYEVKGDQLFLFSMIDNLLKGAASQAVENFNQILGIPVETGLFPIQSIKETN